MGLITHDDFDRRRAKQAVALDVPTSLFEKPVARGGKSREIRHLRARDEPSAPVLGKAKQLLEPARRNLLDRGGHWRHGEHLGVLVPGGHEPIGRSRNRQAAACHEAEITRPLPGDSSAQARGGERVDDLDRIVSACR